MSILLSPRCGSAANLSARTRDSMALTPLDVAAFRGHLEVALEIIADASLSHSLFIPIVSGSYSNPGFSQGSLVRRTSLHLAVMGGNSTLVGCLADHFGGATPPTTSLRRLFDDGQSTTDHRFSSTVEVDESMLSGASGASHFQPSDQVSLIDAPNQEGWTALMMACDKKDMAEAVTRLVEAGADLEVVNKQGDTALIVACRSGNIENALALLEAAKRLADNPSISPSSTAPLSLNSFTSKNPPGSKASLTRPNKANWAGDRALDRACASPTTTPELIRALIDACAVPGLRRRDGTTCLHVAAQVGNRSVCEEIVRWLEEERQRLVTAPSSHLLSGYVGSAIAQSAYMLTSKDLNGLFASDHARRNGHTELADWLASLEQKDLMMLRKGGSSDGDGTPSTNGALGEYVVSLEEEEKQERSTTSSSRT